MPQCQPPVHEGHEGKSEACNDDAFVQDDDFAKGDDFSRDDDFTNAKDDTLAKITFWCHQPKQFPYMGTRERLPIEGLEGNEKKVNFKDFKCFFFESLPCPKRILNIRIRMGTLSGNVQVRYQAVGL